MFGRASANELLCLPGIYRNEEPEAEDPWAVIWSCHIPQVSKNSDAWDAVPAPGLINLFPTVFKGSLPPTRSTIWNYLVNYLWFTHFTEAHG